MTLPPFAGWVQRAVRLWCCAAWPLGFDPFSGAGGCARGWRGRAGRALACCLARHDSPLVNCLSVLTTLSRPSPARHSHRVIINGRNPIHNHAVPQGTRTDLQLSSPATSSCPSGQVTIEAWFYLR
jgi:hypothetical protein